jgi:hypothetical protein
VLGYMLGWLLVCWDGCWGGWMDVGMVVSVLGYMLGRMLVCWDSC